jgi:bacillithiol system protein YtxJ
MQETADDGTARGKTRFVPLRAGSAVGSLFDRSHEVPVILFQHDPYSPISRRAYRELQNLPIVAVLVDVAQDADISRTIEERSGVSHESPQVLVLRSGRVVWSASHFAITRGAFTRALRHATLGQPAEHRESVCGAACGYGDNALKEQSLESPRLGTWLRSAWDGQ